MQSSNTTPNAPSQLAVLGNPSAPVGAHAGTLSVGGIKGLGFGQVSHHWWPDYPWSPPVHHYHHYTTLGTYASKPNPLEIAFTITSMLIEQGIVEEMTVKRFVETVNEIADIVRKEF